MIVNSIPDGITFEQFMGEHSSCPRNRLIARAFYLAGFIESWGRGIGKIRDEFVANGLEAPVYKEEMGGMSVYITRRKGLYGEDGTVNDGVNVVENKDITTNNDHINDHIDDHINDHVNDHVKLSANEKKVLQLMWNDMAINYEQIEKKLKISTSTTMRAIRKLRKEMLVVREGSNKTGYWYVTEKGKELL